MSHAAYSHSHSHCRRGGSGVRGSEAGLDGWFARVLFLHSRGCVSEQHLKQLVWYSDNRPTASASLAISSSASLSRGVWRRSTEEQQRHAAQVETLSDQLRAAAATQADTEARCRAADDAAAVRAHPSHAAPPPPLCLNGGCRLRRGTRRSWR